MDALIVLVMCVAGTAAGVLIVARAAGSDSAPVRGRDPLDTGPSPPCWTEEVGRDGALRLGRGHCVNDALIELDARAARGDFPVAELNTGGG